MSNCVKVYVNKFEEEEKYDNLLYFSVIPNIQNTIEESIRNGNWYKTITYEIEELKDYDEETIDNIIDDVYQYDGVMRDDNEFIVIDNEQHAKVTFYITAWGQWGHTMEEMDD